MNRLCRVMKRSPGSLPPLPAPCPAAWLPSHPTLRPARRFRPQGQPGTGPRTAGCRRATQDDTLGEPEDFQPTCPCCGGRMIVIGGATKRTGRVQLSASRRRPTHRRHQPQIEISIAFARGPRVPSSGTFVRLPAPETPHVCRPAVFGRRNEESRRSVKFAERLR